MIYSTEYLTICICYVFNSLLILFKLIHYYFAEISFSLCPVYSNDVNVTQKGLCFAVYKLGVFFNIIMNVCFG